MQISGALWLGNNQQQLNEKRIELLRQIGRHGSLSAAAKAVGLSYKGAWDTLDAINNLSGKALVIRAAGGKGGGGSVLTEEGERVVHVYDLFAEAHGRFLDLLSSHTAKPQEAYNILQRIGMKTSARNQFSGEITQIRHGSVNDEVMISINTEDKITAILTKESMESMGLTVGAKVYALVKASSVLLASEEPKGISARNVLQGTIERLNDGAVNAEVVLVLPGGTRIAVIITSESLTRLGFSEGQAVWAFFKASSVIIGV